MVLKMAGVFLLFSCILSAQGLAQQPGGQEGLVCIVKGRVIVAGTDVGVPGCRVYVMRGWEEIGQTVSARDGTFSFGPFRTTPGKVRLLTRPPYEIYRVADASVELSKSAEVSVRLQARCVFECPQLRTATLDGRVFAWDGITGVERSLVSVSREDHLLGETRTDDRGTYHLRLDGLPPGEYRLRVETGNDLLREASEALEIGDRDIYRNDRIVLESPLHLPLRRAAVSGRALLHGWTGWSLSGLQIRVCTGEWTLASIETRGGGHFYREKVYVPSGPLRLEIGRGSFLLRSTGRLAGVPEGDHKIAGLKVDIHVRPSFYGYLAAVSAPLILIGGLALLVRLWIWPEWVGIRSRAARQPLRRTLP